MKTLLYVRLLLILFFVTGYSQTTNDTADYEWREISEVTGSITEIYFVDSSNGWMAESSGTIYATNDGGITWILQNSGTTNTLQSIYFMDDKTGIAAGANRTILRTINGGNTWTAVEVDDDGASIYCSLGPALDDSICFISNYGTVHCSGDSGLTWSNTYSFQEDGFSYLDCSNSPVCYAMKLRDSEFYKSTNHEKEWERISPDINDGGNIYFLNSAIGWFSEDKSVSSAWIDSVSIYMTIDGGNTWNRQFKTAGKYLTNTIFLENFEGWLSGYIFTNCADSLALCSGNEIIYYSPDSGKTWINQFECDSSDGIKDIFFLDKDHGWAVTDKGKIIKYGTPIDVSVEESNAILQDEYIISRNYPNPFNPSTTIYYSIPKFSDVTINIYDINGSLVKNLLSKKQSAGTYEILWNGKNNENMSAASGVYLYKIRAGNIIKTSKMILLK